MRKKSKKKRRKEKWKRRSKKGEPDSLKNPKPSKEQSYAECDMVE